MHFHDMFLKIGLKLKNNNYVTKKILKVNSFSVLYLALDNINEKTVVIEEAFLPFSSQRQSQKLIDNQRLIYDGKNIFQICKESLHKQGKVLKQLNNINLVKTFDIFTENNTVYVVYEYLADNNMQNILTISNAKLIAKYYQQALLALHDIHKLGIIHGNINNNSLVLTKGGSLLFKDFAFAEYNINKSIANLKVTNPDNMPYAAPEHYHSYNFSKKFNDAKASDIYSLAALFYHVINKQKLADIRTRLNHTGKKACFMPINTNFYDKSLAKTIQIVNQSLLLNKQKRLQNTKQALRILKPKNQAQIIKTRKQMIVGYTLLTVTLAAISSITLQSLSEFKLTAEKDRLKLIINGDNELNMLFLDSLSVSEQNELLPKIAKSGNKYAQYKLAKIYANKGLSLFNLEKSAYWLEMAAYQDNHMAENDLGIMYRDGIWFNKNIARAIDLFNEAIGHGSSEAMVNLADIYIKGLGVKQNYAKAAELLEQAKEMENARSYAKLADFYQQGILFERNPYQAFLLYKQGAMLDDAYAQTKLGESYEQGLAVEKSYQQAFYWYEKAAELNHAMGQYNLATMYVSGKYVNRDYEKAFFLYQKSAMQNYAPAQAALADMYYASKYVNKDYSEAFYWYEKAALNNNPAGQNGLAIMYELGLYKKTNKKQAKILYEKAANNGNMNAQYNIAMMYYRGQFIDKDYKKAAKYFLQAANQGHAIAQNNLAALYLRGYGVQEDARLAFSWLNKAAEQGYIQAQNNIGMLYRDGIGTAKDYKLAAYWFEKAARAGHKDAQYNLAYAHNIGAGVEKNFFMAMYWYKKAAKQGHVYAQHNLASFYEFGFAGMEKDIFKAAFWYNKAADSGYIESQKKLYQLRKQYKSVRWKFY